MVQMQKLSTNNTTITERDDYMNVTLHSTDVVRFNEQEIILDSGGWNTFTTKARMNQCSNQFNLGYKVIQRDFKWYVEWKGDLLPFADGMKLHRREGVEE